MSDPALTDADADASISGERAVQTAIFRTRMAKELGYGVSGPKNIHQLTYPELRVYAEGLRVMDERERKANQRAAGRSSGRPKGQPRESDKEMLRDLDADLENRE